MPEKGVPLLKNFEPAEYNHQGKIWSIDSAPNGIIYMASDKGLLEYDGEIWRSFKGSDGITRSIHVINDTLIYTGSDLDFGVWRKNKYQKFEYTSLYPFKEDLNRINEEFWDVHSYSDNVFFVSSNNIYIYKSQNLTKIAAPNKIESSFFVNDVLYFVDEVDGLYELKDLTPNHLFHFGDEDISEITGIYEDRIGLVLVTKREGLFRYSSQALIPIDNELSRYLKNSSVFSFEKINEEHLAFGTISDGLLIGEINGEILHSINKGKGLQNNTILSIHHSLAGKLWLSMDYGVSYIDLSNEFTFFYDNAGEFGTGYTALLDDKVFYLGTNQGLYKTNWNDLNNRTNKNKFEFISSSEGQVWTVEKVDEQIWVGHDRGLFTLEGDSLRTLNDQSGFWTIRPYKDVILTGTYNGISIFEKREGKWNYLKQMELILGSCSQILIEGENTLWVNIPNYGIIRSNLNEDIYPENRKIFLSEQFKGEDHYLIETDQGMKVLTSSHGYLFELGSEDFKEQVLPIESKSAIHSLLLKNAQPVKLNNDFEFYPIYNGFSLKELGIDKGEKKTIYQLVIRNILAFNNDEEVIGFDGITLSYEFNNLRIKGIVPNQNEVLYQYKIRDSGGWSPWSSESTFELVGLDHGSYVTQTRAMIDGVITPTETISFRITPPWYKSTYAYALYFLIALISIYLFYIWRSISMNKLKKELLVEQRSVLHKQAEKYQLKLKRIEEEKRQGEYDQLKAQLKTKTIELASKAKENEEINKVLESLKKKFIKLEENPDSIKSRSSEIKQIIDSHINAEDNTFEIQMDELHQEFFEKLRQDFPDLTSYDLRLCAYLKLGFNSKEIANMLNIMPSSVYISRSRLRKKLELDSDEGLHGYLNSI